MVEADFASVAFLQQLVPFLNSEVSSGDCIVDSEACENRRSSANLIRSNRTRSGRDFRGLAGSATIGIPRKGGSSLGFERDTRVNRASRGEALATFLANETMVD